MVSPHPQPHRGRWWGNREYSCHKYYFTNEQVLHCCFCVQFSWRIFQRHLGTDLGSVDELCRLSSPYLVYLYNIPSVLCTIWKFNMKFLTVQGLPYRPFKSQTHTLLSSPPPHLIPPIQASHRRPIHGAFLFPSKGTQGVDFTEQPRSG